MLEIMKASAGSGKTFSLARKYISLLLKSEDRYAYRHILAVTFTNKATDEMKNRIMKELFVLSTEPENSGYRDFFIPSLFDSDQAIRKKAETVLHDILHDYSAFAVSTIDRFFQQTLKAFSREIGQFASYQVELDKESLVAESVDRILDSLTEENGSLLSWLTSNVLEQIEAGGRYSLDANLLEMAKRLKSPQRQEAMEDAAVDEEFMCSKERLMEIRLRCRELIDDFRNEVKKKAAAVLEVLGQAGVDPEESNRKFMKHLYTYSELDENDMVPALSESFMTKAADPDQWFAKAKAKTLLPKVSPFLEAPMEEFCAMFGKDFAVYNTAVILDGQLYGLGVAGEVSRTFRELMKEKNVLCIDDSNTILKDIIDGSDAPFVYEKLGVRFEHFLLDEFQDTARVQWLNFSPLLKNSESQGGENLIVGDVKQSIYRWRGSDWKLLDEIVPGEFDDHVETVLDTNYRSLPAIVDFNNGFFEAAARIVEKMDGPDRSGAMTGIYSDVRQKAAKRDRSSGNVSLTFCEKDMQLQKVLESVKEVRNHGASLSDVAVLVRSNAIGESVASFLIDNGMTVITDDSLRVKNSMMVRRIVSLMSCVENPQDTVGGYLAESVGMTVPGGHMSLIDMAESIFRGLVEADEEGLWRKEAVHVQSFMDCLQDYVSSNGNALRGFLKWWETENPSVSSPSSGDSVRVMTIHKSKGLDFPYVIIPFAESITLYKSGNSWCSPDLKGTGLEGIAEGVYDVTLSSSSADTLFAEDYDEECFLQHVDNMNTLYVAMTRAALGMHVIAAVPSSKCMKAIETGDLGQFSDMSQILYWYVSGLCLGGDVTRTVEDGAERFDVGSFVDFAQLRKSADSDVMTFDVEEGGEYPSVALNPSPGAEGDVRERGRLKFSADSLDFFSHEGDAGISASNRIKGVVMHDILSRIRTAVDLDGAVDDALMSGDITASEAEEIRSLLAQRLAEVEKYGWFTSDAPEILNEASLIDTDGKIYRPDRVVISEGKVSVIDFKLGEHDRRYERQVSGYAGLWRRMGYADVSAYLWYVHTGEVREIL